MNCISSSPSSKYIGHTTVSGLSFPVQASDYFPLELEKYYEGAKKRKAELSLSLRHKIKSIRKRGESSKSQASASVSDDRGGTDTSYKDQVHVSILI